MGVFGKVPVHVDQFTCGHQFVGIRYRAPIDLEEGSGMKGIGFLGNLYLGFDPEYLLYQGILQQPIIDPIRFFLPIQGIDRTVSQPKRLFQVLFVVTRVNVIEISVEEFQMGQDFHAQIFFLGNQFQGYYVPIGIYHKDFVDGFPVQF